MSLHSPEAPAAPLAPPPVNAVANWALAAGLGGLCCPLVSPAAVLLARHARDEIAAANGAQGGMLRARAALALGWAGVGFLTFFVVAFTVLLLLNLLFGLGFSAVMTGIGAGAAAEGA